MSKTTALSVAGKFIDNSFSEGLRLTNMQVQKMVYVANGLYLALTGEPLIEEDVEVWSYGPVIKDLYHSLKRYGNGNINDNLLMSYNYPVPNEKEIQEVMNFTWKACKNANGIKLSNWTHAEDSPWTKAHNEDKDVIPDEYMADYFKKFVKE